MLAFLFISATVFVLGMMAGYFCKPGLIRIGLACISISLVALVGTYFGFSSDLGPHPIGYYITAALYWVMPYVGFFLAPCILGALLGYLIRRRLRPAERQVKGQRSRPLDNPDDHSVFL